MARKSAARAEADLSRLIDDALVYVTCAAYEPARRWGPAVPAVGHCVEATRDERLRRGLSGPAAPEELPTHWGATLLTWAEPGEGKFRLGHAHVMGALEVSRKRSWGLLPAGPGPFVQGEEVVIQEDGRTACNGHLYRLTRARRGRYWSPLNSRPLPGAKRVRKFSPRGWVEYEESEFAPSVAYDPDLLSIVAWSRRHLWQVVLEAGAGSAQLLFVTDALGVKGFFTLRDKPEGKSRRDALLHWVREHTRTIRSDPAVEVAVRQHVRGKVKFDWFGLTGEVREPEEVPCPLPARP